MDKKVIKKFCFIGTVDSGKSSCAGHTYVKCGGLTEHEISKLKTCEKKTQLWSRVLDVWAEEQEKGKTHESSMLELTFKGTKYQMIDTPGHKMFIRSMIEGIMQHDSDEIVACLLISMAKGEFEAGWGKGQTKEDIILARSAGIKHLIVLINKMDLVEWSQKEYDQIVKKIKPFIVGCKFSDVTFIPISGYAGVGLVDMVDMPKWYAGKSFMETMEDIKLDLSEESKSQVVLPDKWQKMIIEIKVLQLSQPAIISAGYECVMHYEGKEYSVVIDRLAPKIKFLKEKDGGKISVISNHPIYKDRGSVNVIFRHGLDTIGFGKITRIIE